MMSRRRQELRATARAYLAVQRLPRGVPDLLDGIARREARFQYQATHHALARVLDRWRKPFMGA